jgi:pteridine reductase
VNSASTFQKRGLLDVTLAEWELTMAVNLRAPFLCTRTAAALMLQNDPPGGAIINILDKGALVPWPEYAHHGISKAGLLALTQVSVASLGPHIRVNGIIPGPVMKPAGAGMSDEAWAALGQQTALKKTGEAGDVGRAAAYLASEDFLSGAIIHVNGGEHLV